MSDSEGRFIKLAAIVLPIAVAGSGPWWWDKVFPPPYMDELLMNTNLQGADVSNIDKTEINTAGECSNRCAADDRCEAMTFVSHPDKPGGICWLKNEVPPEGSTMGLNMVSAIKRYPGFLSRNRK